MLLFLLFFLVAQQRLDAAKSPLQVNSLCSTASWCTRGLFAVAVPPLLLLACCLLLPVTTSTPIMHACVHPE